IDELFNLGEADDFIELLGDFGPAHAENAAIEKNVFAAAQLGVKSGANLQERAHSSVDFRNARRRLGNSRKYFEQCAFARAVSPDDSVHLALLDIDGNIAQSPEMRSFTLAA